MLRTTRHLLEMIRFSHTLFALPFALLAALMAWTTPGTPQRAFPTDSHSPLTTHSSPFTAHHPAPPFRLQDLTGILLCMVAARSAAMAFNRLADRRIDAENPRTKSRHLPAGTLSVASVVLFTLISAGVFVAGTLLFLPNRLPIILSIPVLLLLLGYSYTKRFTALAHFWLGAALMLAPVCVWIALRGEVLLVNPWDILPAVMLGGAVLAWVSGFDIIYACQDVEFDRTQRLRSVPASLGVAGALRLAAVCHLVTLGLLAALPLVCPQVPLGWIYGTGVGVIAALLAYEHLLVRPDDLTRVNIAFFHINAIISIGLFVVGAIDLLT
ncbi:MAG TPA: 4-hydroxybenzoate octaprenyltransferase [Pirellulaceae bacterium]|nr:4-hydroxybenzoate octaprenyltransferase [Pirellulaceae bacterium]